MTDVNVTSAVADAADVIAVPRQEPADSFVLHAPLELLARFLTGSRACEIVQATKARTRRVEVLSPLRRDP